MSLFVNLTGYSVHSLASTQGECFVRAGEFLDMSQAGFVLEKSTKAGSTSSPVCMTGLKRVVPQRTNTFGRICMWHGKYILPIRQSMWILVRALMALLR